jgi:hypothetical protein
LHGTGRRAASVVVVVLTTRLGIRNGRGEAENLLGVATVSPWRWPP